MHVGTTCGTCKMSPIVGVRYTRPAPGGGDLDLCEPCLLAYRTGPARGRCARRACQRGPGRHEWLRQRRCRPHLAQGLNAVQRYAIRGEGKRAVGAGKQRAKEGDDCRDHRAAPRSPCKGTRNSSLGGIPVVRPLERVSKTRCHASRGPSPPQLARCDPPPAVALGFSAAPGAYHPNASGARREPASGRSLQRLARQLVLQMLT